jgi:CRISPR system Cascade subunit CasB
MDQLEKLADPSSPNRAVLAHLRKGLGDNPTYTLSRAGWLFSGFKEHDEDAAILTAGLFAWAKGKCSNVNGVSIGKAFAQLPGAGDNASIERRFVDLLDTDRNDLDFKLRQVVSLLAQHSLPLDWGQLCRHLVHWDHPNRWVQKQWARDFWRFATSEIESPPETETRV